VAARIFPLRDPGNQRLDNEIPVAAAEGLVRTVHTCGERVDVR
jgi:hypothetical protein